MIFIISIWFEYNQWDWTRKIETTDGEIKSSMTSADDRTRKREFITHGMGQLHWNYWHVSFILYLLCFCRFQKDEFHRWLKLSVPRRCVKWHFSLIAHNVVINEINMFLLLLNVSTTAFQYSPRMQSLNRIDVFNFLIKYFMRGRVIVVCCLATEFSLFSQLFSFVFCFEFLSLWWCI